MSTWREGEGTEEGRREEPKRARGKQENEREVGQAAPFIVGQAYLAVSR